MATEFDMSGKVAMVTGASSGFGVHFAKILAARGAKVVVAARRIDRLESLVAEIIAEGGEALAVSMDVTNSESIATAFDQGEAAFGTITLVANNAGIAEVKSAIKIDESSWDNMMDTNLKGVFIVAQQAAKRMMAAGVGGVIVNTASISALQPGPMQGIYSITKAAVVNMTKVFAKECAPFGIRCNALLPGLTKTKFAGALFSNEDIYQAAVQAIPMGRHAEPSEMAGTVLYLVSDASSYTTGECITVDGGMTI